MMSCRNVDYRPIVDDTDTSGMNTYPKTAYPRSLPYSSGCPKLKWWMIPMLNTNALEMLAIEPLLSLSGTHT